jgi:hypothetical protein
MGRGKENVFYTDVDAKPDNFLFYKICSVMVPTLEEDGTVASIISFTLRRETSIEYEPY